MVCYFLYLVDITILYLYTYNGVDSKYPEVGWREGYQYNVRIYHTSFNLSIPEYIININNNILTKLRFSLYGYN